MKRFYTSDFHLGHKNLYTSGFRKFSCPEEAEELLRENFNKVIDKQDHLWILGDLTLNSPYDYVADYLSSLNGVKFVIHGNHDRSTILDRLMEDGIIANWHYSKGVHDRDKETGINLPIYMNHMPLFEWHTGCFRLHLHGHTHGLLRSHDVCPFRFDVGVDACNFQPLTFDTKAKKYFNDLLHEGCNASVSSCMLRGYCPMHRISRQAVHENF